jgi:hypothetical protein
MSIAEVKWIDLPSVDDERGTLTAIEAGAQVPFEIRRVFYLHGVRAERGGHALRSTRHLLVPVAGRFCIELTDGNSTAKYSMNDPRRGLYVPPLTWIRLAEFSSDAVCLVLAETHFADVEYVRDWDAFLTLSGNTRVRS